jgi:hypothetical protein
MNWAKVYTYNVASSILAVNCGVGGSLIKKKQITHYVEFMKDFALTYSTIINFERP